MSQQELRRNMAQLRQAAPVASSFPFDDPTLQLEQLLPPTMSSIRSSGAEFKSQPFQAPAHIGMEHKASTKPYDPLAKYGLSFGEHALDMFMGGDTRKVKHALATAEEPFDYFGKRKPLYDPAIEQAFMPLDLVAGSGMPQMLSAAGKFGLKHSPEALDVATRAASGGLSGFKPKLEMTAYHGSPHKFDRFKMSQIGTGEGAQAYGHGLYFAESPDVAKGYREKLSSTRFIDEAGAESNELRNFTDPESKARYMVLRELEDQQYREGFVDFDTSKAMTDAKEMFEGNISLNKEMLEKAKKEGVEGFDYLLDDIGRSQSAISKLESLSPDQFKVDMRGHLYEVDIPEEHVKTFLDWDAPLSEQAESVQKGIRGFMDKPKASSSELQKIIDDDPLGLLDDFANADYLGGRHGSSIYADINNMFSEGDAAAMKAAKKMGYDPYSAEFGAKRSDELTSEFLNSIGIKGLKYYDASSRGAGAGTRNLVAFDEDIVKTISRNGTDLSQMMRKLEADNGF